MTQSPLTEPKKLWNIPYILVLTVSTLSSFSFYMVATILSKYLVGLGASITFAGFVVGLFSITSLVCRPFCGVMADRLNNIWLLIVSNLLMSIGLLGFVFTNSMPLMILFQMCIRDRPQPVINPPWLPTTSGTGSLPS